MSEEAVKTKDNQETKTAPSTEVRADRRAARHARSRRSRNSAGGPNNRRRGSRNNKRRNNQEDDKFESRLIQVRRVTRVVKGGKRMSFSALVAVGDMEGKVGIGLMKGMDFQDAVGKATRKAKQNIIKIHLDENQSLEYPSKTKYKSSLIYLKPADSGTGIIAGGFLRSLLELAGVKNIYSKIIGSRNKITGTQSAFEALKKYQEKKNI
jgi:small subunit ribosomal protein S5